MRFAARLTTLLGWGLCLTACLAGETRRSTVGTTDAKNGWAVNYPKQHKLLWMAGRLWLFYSDGRDALYRTSRDGAEWGPPVLVHARSSVGHRLGCWFDGTRLHYAHCASQDGEDVVYRCGVPNADGTVCWLAPEQVAYAVPADKNVMYPKVIVDSQGAPWIAFMLYDGAPRKAPYDAVVTKAAGADGAWATAPGFPQVLVDDNTTAYPDPVGVPLTCGKTYWVYNKNVLDDGYYGRLWDGRSWQAEERATVAHSSRGLYSLAAEGDRVHLVFGGGKIRYRARDAASGWGEEFQVASAGSGHTSITRTGPNSLVVTWLDKSLDSVCYREMDDGRWGEPQRWLDESRAHLANTELGINSAALAESAGPFKLAVAYTTGTRAPYPIEFAAWLRSAAP